MTSYGFAESMRTTNRRCSLAYLHHISDHSPNAKVGSHDMTWGTENKKRLRRGGEAANEELLGRKVVESILCGQTIPVTVTDLLEKNCLILVENERRRIGRLMRGIPT